MTDGESPTEITFSKKVDTDGRMVVPQEHRQALTIEGREALVEFTAKKVTYLDDDGGDQ
jgi:bifunctional DNA-binding transcriptional regulator/antitoxin component of YhaV-PrlF toxin-antitoxin module